MYDDIIHISIYVSSVESTGRVLVHSAMAKLLKGTGHNVMYWHNVGQ